MGHTIFRRMPTVGYSIDRRVALSFSSGSVGALFIYGRVPQVSGAADTIRYTIIARVGDTNSNKWETRIPRRQSETLRFQNLFAFFAPLPPAHTVHRA